MNPVFVAGVAFIASLLKFLLALSKFLQEPDTAPVHDEGNTIRVAAASLMATLQSAADRPVADPSPGGTSEQARSELKASYYRWQAAVYPRLHVTERRRVGVIREAVLGQAGLAANAQWLSDEITQMTNVAVGRVR